MSRSCCKECCIEVGDSQKCSFICRELCICTLRANPRRVCR